MKEIFEVSFVDVLLGKKGGGWFVGAKKKAKRSCSGDVMRGSRRQNGASPKVMVTAKRNMGPVDDGWRGDRCNDV